MGRTQAEEANFEIDGVEYGPASQHRSPVADFRVGDRIGRDGPNSMLITRSEQSPDDPECWCLTWVLPDGTAHDYEGDKSSKDYRWVQTLYVIQERAEL